MVLGRGAVSHERGTPVAVGVARSDFGIRVESLGGEGVGFRVWGLGCRVEDLGFKV